MECMVGKLVKHLVIVTQMRIKEKVNKEISFIKIFFLIINKQFFI